MTPEPTSSVDIEHIARLARIHLSPAEKELFAAQLESVLDYFRDLAEAPVDELEPMAHPIDFANVWDADEPGPCMEKDLALALMQETQDGMVRVPKVVG